MKHRPLWSMIIMWVGCADAAGRIDILLEMQTAGDIENIVRLGPQHNKGGGSMWLSPNYFGHFLV